MRIVGCVGGRARAAERFEQRRLHSVGHGLARQVAENAACATELSEHFPAIHAIPQVCRDALPLRGRQGPIEQITQRLPDLTTLQLRLHRRNVLRRRDTGANLASPSRALGAAVPFDWFPKSPWRYTRPPRSTPPRPATRSPRAGEAAVH